MTETVTALNSAGYEAPLGLAADAVVFTLAAGSLSVLLNRRPDAPRQGAWSLPGGFVGAGEDPAETIARKLAEKTGLAPVYLEQLRTYAAPGRDERGWLPSVCYLALVPSELLPAEGPNEAAWTPLNELPPLAFDHARMISDGLERLQGKLSYSNIAAGLLPAQFTIAQARAVYEAIGGAAVDAPNLSRRLRASGLVAETGETACSGSTLGGRPAKLYRFLEHSAGFTPAPAGTPR